MATARSNPFDDIEGLIEALKKAPQDKEGAFRVATWLMVLQKIKELSDQLGETNNVINETKSQTPSVDELKQQIKEDIQRDMSSEDADVILF